MLEMPRSPKRISRVERVIPRSVIDVSWKHRSISAATFVTKPIRIVIVLRLRGGHASGNRAGWSHQQPIGPNDETIDGDAHAVAQDVDGQLAGAFGDGNPGDALRGVRSTIPQTLRSLTEFFSGVLSVVGPGVHGRVLLGVQVFIMCPFFRWSNLALCIARHEALCEANTLVTTFDRDPPCSTICNAYQ